MKKKPKGNKAYKKKMAARAKSIAFIARKKLEEYEANQRADQVFSRAKKSVSIHVGYDDRIIEGEFE